MLNQDQTEKGEERETLREMRERERVREGDNQSNRETDRQTETEALGLLMMPDYKKYRVTDGVSYESKEGN